MISFEFLKQSPISSPRTSPPPSPASSDRILALQQNTTVPSPRARSSSSGSFSSSSGPPSGGFSASPLLARDDHWTSQLTAEQLKELSYEQRQKQEAIQEIVLAERAYVRDLRLITRVFMDEMRDRGMVTKEEAASIFSNIPTLLDVHTGLLNELEQLKREQGMISDEGLGNIFLERTNLFKHYAHYCVNHISMSQKLAALRENHKIAEFLEDCKKIPECRSSGVESFLITPLQRMVKYPLLLASLLKYVDKENPEYAPLAKAYEEIKNVVDQVNKRAQQEEDVHKVMDLQSAVELVHGLEVYKFSEWGRHIVKEGPVRLLGGRRKSKNQDFHLVLFNDKIALFRVKAKGKRKGYKVLNLWEGHMLSCSPLECPPPTLAASSPSQGSTPPVNRLRAFSRNNTDNVLTSPRTVSPAHSSPRGRSVRNLREETETIDEVVRVRVHVLMNLTGKFKECGLRLVEKEKEWIEYRVLFSSVAEKEDWIAKMKVLKVEFQSSEGSGDAKAISPDAVNALVWEKRYHLEVGIRTELKRVLDTTTHQLNEARDEIETLKKEREKLKKKIARLKESKKKKDQREREKKEERKEVGRRANERDRVQQMEEKKPKDRDWLNIGGRLRSLSSEIDEVIFQRFEHQDQVQQLRANNRPGGLSHSVEMPRVQESSGNNEAQPHTKDGGKGKSTTLGRKSMVTTHRRKERDRMLFLDLPFRVGSSTSRSADASTTSGGEEPLKPCSAREPRARPDGAQGSPKPVRVKKSTPTKDLEPLTGGAEVLSKSSPRTPDPKKPSPRSGGATDQSASTGGSPANDKREARKSLPRREHDVGKGSPRASTKDQEQPGAGPAGGERSSPRAEGVRRSSGLSDKHERKSSPRKDHERAAHGTSGLSTSNIVGMPSTGDVLERRLHQSD